MLWEFEEQKVISETLLFCLLILQVGKMIHRKFEYLLRVTQWDSQRGNQSKSFESKAMFFLLCYIIWRLQEYYYKTLDYWDT